MSQFELTAEPREVLGKGASRRLRRAGKVPAVLYGGKKEPVSIQMEENALVKQLGQEAIFSNIITLNLNGEKIPVVLKDLQSHPHRRQALHLDLQRVEETETLTLRVPLHFLNEEKCVGVKTGGGTISHLMSELEIVCLPKDLPEFIAIDMVEVNIGETIHLGEITLPEGVQIAALLHGGDPQRAVVSVHVPKVEEDVKGEDEAGEDEVGEDNESAEGEGGD